ncbi:hypothetical protein [Streptomyces sp. NPDC029721]|uniref:GFA family protein n=1 Tax=Streptomyces sp. NPDC029721 TaxID=3157090 RepID=UPI0033C67155
MTAAAHQRARGSPVAAQEPDGEIALGLQLKHAARRAMANRTTLAFGKPDARWAKEFDNQLQAAAAKKPVSLLQARRAGQTSAVGPGAARFHAELDKVNDVIEQSARTHPVAEGVHPMTSPTPTSTAARAGGCQCGKLQFTVTGEPDYPHTCSCGHCQALSGGPLMSWVSFPLAGLKWTGAGGVPAWHYTRPDSRRQALPLQRARDGLLHKDGVFTVLLARRPRAAR